MAGRPPPISLRLRSDVATRHARSTLLRLSEDELLGRRIKWQAMKAIIAIRELAAVTGPEIERISRSEHSRWRKEIAQIEAFLGKIKSRG
jgi:hypothetical protein